MKMKNEGRSLVIVSCGYDGDEDLQQPCLSLPPGNGSNGSSVWVN